MCHPPPTPHGPHRRARGPSALPPGPHSQPALREGVGGVADGSCCGARPRLPRDGPLAFCPLCCLPTLRLGECAGCERSASLTPFVGSLLGLTEHLLSFK